MLEREMFHARVIQVLRDSRVFGSLREATLNALAAGLQQQDVRGGHLVLEEGAPADSMLFVVTGRLRVSSPK